MEAIKLTSTFPNLQQGRLVLPEQLSAFGRRRED